MLGAAACALLEFGQAMVDLGDGGRGATGVEVTVTWHGELLAARRFGEGDAIRIGEGPGTLIAIDSELLGCETCTIATIRRGAVRVAVPANGARGLVRGEDAALSGPSTVLLEVGDWLAIELGTIVLTFTPSVAEKLPRGTRATGALRLPLLLAAALHVIVLGLGARAAATPLGGGVDDVSAARGYLARAAQSAQSEDRVETRASPPAAGETLEEAPLESKQTVRAAAGANRRTARVIPRVARAPSGGGGDTAGVEVGEKVGGQGFAPGQIYNGSYLCRQGRTALTLRVVRADGDDFEAVFDFNHAESGARGSYLMRGHRNLDTRSVALRPERWIARPERYVMVGMDGVLSEDGRRLSGRMTHPTCGSFDVSR